MHFVLKETQKLCIMYLININLRKKNKIKISFIFAQIWKNCSDYLPVIWDLQRYETFFEQFVLDDYFFWHTFSTLTINKLPLHIHSQHNYVLPLLICMSIIYYNKVHTITELVIRFQLAEHGQRVINVYTKSQIILF